MSDNQSNTRKATELEKEVFNYLNDLRSSGETNMFGAAPYVVRQFDIPKSEANSLCVLWMKNFSEDRQYDTIFE